MLSIIAGDDYDNRFSTDINVATVPFFMDHYSFTLVLYDSNSSFVLYFAGSDIECPLYR